LNRRANITDMPNEADFVRFDQTFGTRFVVTVDTEEEFDWNKPLDRTSHGLEHVPRLARFQQFCESFGVVPVYLIDYPIATSAAAVEVLGEAVKAGRAEVGVQLHPWVNPPFDEVVSEHNSFTGNLPEGLERAKFCKLRDAIEAAFGVAPQIYRAGRYGVGPSTASILSECGISIDTSVRARFDYSYNGGVNFRDLPLRPWWIDKKRRLMEMPLTTIYWGLLRQQGTAIYPALWRAPRLRGALARLGLLERIPLTPEGITLDEAIKGIDIAIDDGLPILVFSFHSPSICPGHTPYVRTEAELDAFYDWWRGVFTYLARRGITPASVRDIAAAIQV
jgi:hypothetical protein